VPGTSHRPEPEDEFHGVPEATFPTMADLEQFQAHSQVQMEDGVNFTLAGVRGVAVADIIGRLGALSQRDPAVSSLFLPAPG
jgi:hypothetical protein